MPQLKIRIAALAAARHMNNRPNLIGGSSHHPAPDLTPFFHQRQPETDRYRRKPAFRHQTGTAYVGRELPGKRKVCS